jgi:hypothetical protein
MSIDTTRLMELAGLLTESSTPVTEVSSDNSLHHTAGEMISQVGLYTKKNADKLDQSGSGNLYRFFDTPQQKEELIKISEEYKQYLNKVKTTMELLMKDPMYQVAIGDAGAHIKTYKTPGEILDKAYNRAQNLNNL